MMNTMLISDYKKLDLHMHTNHSDGSDTPEEALAKVRAAGIDCFSITDHDGCLACDDMKKLLVRDGEEAEIRNGVIFTDGLCFVNGIEFSCKDDKGKYHILGYGFDDKADPIRFAIRKSHGMRIYKFLERVSFLEDEFGFVLPEDRIDELMKLDNPGSPHLAELMVEYGYVKTIKEGIEEFIQKKKFKDKNLSPGEAIKAIALSGGIPVLAHPVFGSGSQNIRGEQLEARIKYLIEMGIEGLEGYYSKYDASMQEEVIGLAEKYGLYVTGGSDYHGTIKTVSLGETHLTDMNDIPEGMRRFFSRLFGEEAVAEAG